MLLGIAVVCYWGYRYPAAAEAAGGYLSLLVGTIMFLMGLGIGFHSLSLRISAWLQNAVTVILCYLVAPLLAFGTAVLFFQHQLNVYTGLILIGTTSTTLSTCIVFTRLAGGDEALALWLSVTSSFLCSFLSPLLLELFLGETVVVPVGIMIKRLLFVLLFPLSAGMLLRAALGEKRIAPLGNLLTRGCGLIILTVIMVAVAKGRNLIVGWSSLPILGAAAALHLALLGIASLASRQLGFSRPESIAIFFCASQKTLQIPTYIAIEILKTPEAALAPVIFHIFQLLVDSLFVSYFSSRSA